MCGFFLMELRYLFATIGSLRIIQTCKTEVEESNASSGPGNSNNPHDVDENGRGQTSIHGEV